MKNLAVRGAFAFGIPILVVFAVSPLFPPGYYFLAAGPLCGIVGGFALGRRWGLSIVLGLCFGLIGFMFALQDIRSALFSEIVWTGLVSAFLFWSAGGCAMLTLPPHMRFNGAAAFGIPGAFAGMAFQFLYGPGRFLFDLGSRTWWTTNSNSPWEHLILWLIAGAGGGCLLGFMWQRRLAMELEEKVPQKNPWALASIVCALLGFGIGGFYFIRSSLPLGLFNSLSPASAAADWLWGWGLLAAAVAGIALFKPKRRLVTAAGMALAVILVVVSYRVEANPWKSQFDLKYAEKLLRDNSDSGDAVYTGNLILAQSAVENGDITAAKSYLLEAVSKPGVRLVEQNGLDITVMRVLYERGEKETALEYLRRGRDLWPQGAQTIGRWEAAVKSGRRLSTRGPGGGQGGYQDR